MKNIYEFEKKIKRKDSRRDEKHGDDGHDEHCDAVLLVEIGTSEGV